MSAHWTFLTNHAHLLLAVARDPDVRVHDLAGVVGISERAALMILEDLEHAGYLERQRIGRRNRYTVHPHRPFRHPTTAAHDVDELLAIFTGRPGDTGAGPATGTDAHRCPDRD
ncbi:helix-turn-helix transcriptional regulator [Cellulomonas aerilata]|uniref:ArsR family transcriptional regulator n=1 Tax=Cellulomonas aerilata TaxID=515326 RepID=A0A512DCG7_9CELL|nr:winged helix-turn-helix domain-containing protein [Cellulomonas aerilata]GEO34146.1 ArsR family transcriptional regulator [Cellulomonas aerilata]